ncbi:dendritic cell-specific transmembrane protein [Brachyhypopomus gauderio]|uniref:dendritic cell-specific transmembrane protein n=1 Tax=Brachyhypopomus gauderio TaxID=698409 RepID=UPI004041AC65
MYNRIMFLLHLENRISSHCFRLKSEPVYTCVKHTCASDTAMSRPSWMELISCLITSLILALLLFFGLQLPFQYGLAGSVPVTVVFWLCAMLAMGLSRRARCFGILLLMSIGLKQGRNLLTMAGTTAVVFLNIQNSLRNLRGLAKSLLCTIKEKILDVNLSPLNNYFQMLKWVATQLKLGIQGLDISGRYYPSFKFNSTVHSQNFTNKIAEAERILNETTENALATINQASLVVKQVSPALGVVLLIVFTALYLRRFRSDRDHNNIFITWNFLKYDEEQRLLGRPSVFPLSRKESERYIMVPSARITRREAKAMLKFSIPIMTHVMTWMFFIGVDSLLYWVITVLRTRLEELQPLHVPVVLNAKMGTSVAGISYNEDRKIYNLSYDVSIFEWKCLPTPELWLDKSLLPLSGILGLLVLLVMVSSKLDQLRVLTAEQCFADVAEKRIVVLHTNILSRRSNWKVETTKPSLKSFTTQIRFWFPILFHHQKNNLENIT